MNSTCPTCGTHFFEAEEPVDFVPYTEDPDPEVVGVLTFCSKECRAEYKENEE